MPSGKVAGKVEGRPEGCPDAPAARPLWRAALAAIERRKDLIGIVSVAIVLLLSGFALHRLLAEMRLAQVGDAIRAISGSSVAASVALSAASYLTLIGYDWSALRYVGCRLAPRVIAFASFCGYAVGNTVGFALLTGGSVRFRIYSAAGLRPDEIGRVAVFCVVAFGFGICAVSGIGVLLRPDVLAGTLGVPVGVLQGLSFASIAGVVGFLALCARRAARGAGRLTAALPSVSLVAGQLTISALDLCFASAALWVLLPDELNLSFFGFLPLYCVAIVAGIMSHVPGGLGVFEAVLVFALGDQTDKGMLVGALLVYRLVYYVLPLLLAGVLLGTNELRRQLPAARAAFDRIIVLTGELVPTVASLLVVLAGMVLLASAATPMGPERAAVIASIVPLPAIEAAHFLSGLAASALVLMAPALQRRLNAAYWMVHALLVAGIVCSLVKGLDWEEATILACIAALLLPYRKEFYRRTSLLDQPLTPGWIVAIASILGGAVWLTMFAYKYVEYDDSMWFQFAFEADAPRSLRALFAAVLAIVAIAGVRLLRAPQRPHEGAPPEEVARAAAVARDQRRADALMVAMGDKEVMFSVSGRSFLMFARQGTSCIALFDPIGIEGERSELVWRFREFCDRERLRPAFYQVRPDNLALYVDVGLTLTKLGEEARVHLEAFDIAQPRNKPLRYATNRCPRDGLAFRVVEGEDVPGIADALACVSNEWLAAKNVREKRFSLGAFTPEYVSRFAVACVMRGNEIVAFATLLLTDRKEEGTLDIMRHRSDVPALTMDFLITSSILHLQQRGIRWFNLGMAPLSGLEQRRLAPLRHRLGALVFEHGEQFYNFRGLRRFKEKFDPVWEPRYLATPGGVEPLIVLADAAALIGGGSWIGVVRK